MVPDVDQQKDHRIRLNDSEIDKICRALDAYDWPEHTTEAQKARRLRLRLATLGSYRR